MRRVMALGAGLPSCVIANAAAVPAQYHTYPAGVYGNREKVKKMAGNMY